MAKALKSKTKDYEISISIKSCNSTQTKKQVQEGALDLVKYMLDNFKGKGIKVKRIR